MHVTLVGGFDPSQDSAGGVRGYVESIERYLSRHSIPHLTIVAGPSFEQADGRCVLPVRETGSTWHFLASLCANMMSIPIPPDSIIHAQRPDELVPFILANRGSGRVCTLHGNPYRGILASGRHVAGALYRFSERFSLRSAGRLIFVDKTTASEYVRRYPWLALRSQVIPNAIDVTSFHPMDRVVAKRRWGLQGTVLLYAGRLEREKRVLEIIEAFRQLQYPDATLVVAGDGRERPAVNEAASGLRVRVLGAVARRDMPSLMNAADALVLYSSREGLPSVVLEALACGTPVIATPVGAIPDIVRLDAHCVLVNSGGDLKQAMEAVSAGRLPPSETLAGLVQPYSWDAIGARLLDVYRLAQQPV